MRSEVIAILCSDLHLSLKPPLARAGEPDWFEAQKRVLDQIEQVSKTYKAPILFAGDLFDRWNSPPELINFAMTWVPRMYAIPGQHDLPTHSLELMYKSAYWTLREAGVIVDLSVNRPFQTNDGLVIQGFPWGVPLTPNKTSTPSSIALVHQYVWKDGHSYPGAPKEAQVHKQRKLYKGWDAVAYGDNHKGFQATRADTNIFNCGTLMRRKSDEIAYKPQVGLWLGSGLIEPYYLDTKDDIITETEKPRTVEEDMELREFLEELTKLQDSCLDFEEAMKKTLDKRKPSPAVRKLILEAMGQ